MWWYGGILWGDVIMLCGVIEKRGIDAVHLVVGVVMAEVGFCIGLLQWFNVWRLCCHVLQPEEGGRRADMKH